MIISDHNDAFFLYNLRPVQDYFCSYETGKSVTGGKGENTEKTNLHTRKQNLVCVTCDCKTDQLGRTYGEEFIVLVLVVAKAILLR